MDSEELAYRRMVYDIWAVSKLARTFADDLIDVTLENGFLIETVTIVVSSCDYIKWVGTCYDADMVDYKFEAVWTCDMKKFTASDRHYYELTSLDIEPR